MRSGAPGAAWSNPLAGITCLGDSQTDGDSWVTTLAASIGETIRNEGHASGKVGWALELDKDDPYTTPNTTFPVIEIWSRRKSRLYIVWFGLNDSVPTYLGAETSEAVREQTFEDRLADVCRICIARGGKVALLATQQYDSSLTDYVSRNDRTDRYDARKPIVAAMFPGNVFFIPETGFTMDVNDHLSASDLHFAAAGETKMAAAVETGLGNAGLLL